MQDEVFTEFFRSSLDMFCIAGTDGYFKMVNPSFEKTLGWTKEELLSHPFFDFIHPEDIEGTRKELDSLASGYPTRAFENRYRCTDGSYRTLLWTAIPKEKTGLLFASAKDTTDMLVATNHFPMAINAFPIAIIMVNSEGLIRLVNKEAERLFGYNQDELQGCSIEMLIPSDYHATHQEYRESFIQNPESRPMGHGRYLTAVRQNGKEFPVEIGLTPIQLPKGLQIIASIIDISLQRALENRILKTAEELREANQQLVALAVTDELTGLLNRRAFNDQLLVHIQLMQRMASTLSLLLVDVDHFKEVNDQFGHPAGDNVLKAIAEVLEQNTRASDIVARYGGEEFAMILPITEASGAVELGEKLRRMVQDNLREPTALTISVGVSTIEFHLGETAREEDYRAMLVSAADEALYHSKENGRNQVTHAADIDPMGDVSVSHR